MFVKSSILVVRGTIVRLTSIFIVEKARRLAALLILPLIVTSCVGVGVVTNDRREEVFSGAEARDKKEVLGTHRLRRVSLESYMQSGTEVYVHEKSDWCGVLLVILPLMLPVCEGADTYYFENDKLVRFEYYELNFHGFFCGMFPMCEGGSDCSICYLGM